MHEIFPVVTDRRGRITTIRAQVTLYLGGGRYASYRRCNKLSRRNPSAVWHIEKSVHSVVRLRRNKLLYCERRRRTRKVLQWNPALLLLLGHLKNTHSRLYNIFRSWCHKHLVPQASALCTFCMIRHCWSVFMDSAQKSNLRINVQFAAK